MTPERRIELLRRAVDELSSGRAGMEERFAAGRHAAAVGYLDGAVKAALNALGKVLDEIDPPRYATCMEQVSDGQPCGKTLVYGVCPEHGSLARGYSLDRQGQCTPPCTLRRGHIGPCVNNP